MKERGWGRWRYFVEFLVLGSWFVARRSGFGVRGSMAKVRRSMFGVRCSPPGVVTSVKVMKPAGQVSLGKRATMGVSQLENLECYRLAFEVAVEMDDLARACRSRDNYPLCNQLRRASISIPANIAEGFGRTTSKEFARFVEISRGSGYEVLSLINLAHRLGYITSEQCAGCKDRVQQTLRKLTSFHKYLRTSKAPYL